MCCIPQYTRAHCLRFGADKSEKVSLPSSRCWAPLCRWLWDQCSEMHQFGFRWFSLNSGFRHISRLQHFLFRWIHCFCCSAESHQQNTKPSKLAVWDERHLKEIDGVAIRVKFRGWSQKGFVRPVLSYWLRWVYASSSCDWHEDICCLACKMLMDH